MLVRHIYIYVCVFYGLTDMLGCFGQTYHVLTSVPNGFRMVIYWDFFGGLVKSKTNHTGGIMRYIINLT